MDGTDVSYEAKTVQDKTIYLSIFQYMTPQAFAPYAAKGFKPSDFILTRAEVDAKNYRCNGEEFVRSPGSNYLKQYLAINPNPYQNLWTSEGDSSINAQHN